MKLAQEQEQRQRRLAISQAVVMGALAAIFLISTGARGSDQKGTLTEEFHNTYPLAAQGRIQVENINGPVHITVWDRNEVKVDAVKSAGSQERLDQAKIDIRSDQGDLSISTNYPEHDRDFNFGSRDELGNPASVEYTITVPRQARLDEIKLINGRLDVRDVAGEVNASCINGRIEARNLQGSVNLSTVNGELDASVDQLPASELKLSSVNGGVRVTLPSDVRAELKATTVSGNISDDFGLSVTRHQYVGRSLHGQLGGGGTLVKLSSVNGRIEIRHAADNRPLSPAQNLEHGRDGDQI
jgi:DUF4097 and DUF4098 domain-containing protein YvlB